MTKNQAVKYLMRYDGLLLAAAIAQLEKDRDAVKKEDNNVNDTNSSKKSV